VVSGTIAPSAAGDKNDTRLCQAKANRAEEGVLRLGRPNVVLWASSWERESLLVGSGGHQRVLKQGSAQWYSTILGRMEQRVHRFQAAGATVVMLTQPPFVQFGSAASTQASDEEFQRLNELEARFAARTPNVVLVNLAAKVCPSGSRCPLLVDDVFVRGDGAHYTAEGSLWVARWLLPRLHVNESGRQANPLPVMGVVRPFSGTVVRGERIIDAEAPFHFGVTRVDFRLSGAGIDDKLIGSVTAYRQYGWYFTWPSTSVPNGTYKLWCVAYNASGNHSTSAPIAIRVQN
jgi:hypothetical protein